MKRLFGFMLAGGVATIFNYSTFLFLFNLGWNPSLASALGYISGIGISYYINNKFVFSGSPTASFFKYAVVYLFALGLQMVILNSLLFVAVEARVANAIAILVVVIINYFIMKRIVFNSP